ncbi:MAG: hypothetical protein FJW40_26140 [Acidobacteria bacterium]|nr:hypothetical protein [Acidobacteriota bacterium]
MKRISICALFAGLLATVWMGTAQNSPVSGHGKWKFRVLFTSSHLPAEAQAVLKGAHGGFAVDTRPGRGETYFSLKNAGIIQISGDLKSTKMVETPAPMKGFNMHNTTLWTAPDGTPYLTWPGNENARVFTTTLDGKLVHELKTPEPGVDLGNPQPNDYFAGAGNFIPTDTEFLDGMIYVATGYSKLDYVLTAKVSGWKPFKAAWHDLSFGGKGSGPGQFGTAHGITIPPGTNRLDIADRPNAEIDRFSRYGQYLSTLRTPLGSFPCDIHYLKNLAVVGALNGPDGSKGAPIYLYENDHLVSTIMVKNDLGLPNFDHIHNAVLREHNGKLYIIAQAWNPGDFAILEHVQ